MNITVYTATDDSLAAAQALLERTTGTLRDPAGKPVDVAAQRVAATGASSQDLPLSVVQVMALKGGDTFPLTVVDGHPVKSGNLPASDELLTWAADGVTAPAALVTDATSAVEFAGASRVHISLDVTNVEAALPFYMVLFDARPVKRRDDYAKFELEEPRLNITLNEHDESHASSGHYGIQVKSTSAVKLAQQRLDAAGFSITEEAETACCYAVQSKFWVVDPDGNRWEVFVVTEAEADEGCGADCVCYQDLERSFISGVTAATATSTAAAPAGS